MFIPKVAPVTTSEIIIKDNNTRISEHMWLYFEFSYDPNFTNPEDLIVPDAGVYSVSISQNGTVWAEWDTSVPINTANYDRLYKVAGMVLYVKAVPTTPVTTTVPPPNIGDVLHARMTWVKV